MAPPPDVISPPNPQETTQDAATRLEQTAQTASTNFAAEVWATLSAYKTQSPDDYQAKSDALFRQINADLGGDKQFPGLVIFDKIDRQISGTDDFAADFSGVEGVATDDQGNATGDVQLNGAVIDVDDQTGAITTTMGQGAEQLVTTARPDGSTTVQHGDLNQGGWSTTTQADGTASLQYGAPDANNPKFEWNPTLNNGEGGWTGPGLPPEGRKDLTFDASGAHYSDGAKPVNIQPNGTKVTIDGDKIVSEKDGAVTTTRIGGEPLDGNILSTTVSGQGDQQTTQDTYPGDISVTRDSKGNITQYDFKDKDGTLRHFRFGTEPDSGHWGYVAEVDDQGKETGDRIRITSSGAPRIDPDGSIHFVQDGGISDGSKRINPAGDEYRITND